MMDGTARRFTWDFILANADGGSEAYFVNAHMTSWVPAPSFCCLFSCPSAISRSSRWCWGEDLEHFKQ